MKLLLRSFSFILLFSLFKSYGCLNMYFTIDGEGHVHTLGTKDFIGFNKNFNARLIHKKLKQTLTDIKTHSSPERLSDYAVLLLKAGKVNEGLVLLQTLQFNYPEEYALASNLGTAYELTGEPDSALHYIQLGMELNPNAHEGSEWVHVKILETKMALSQDSSYLETNSILDLSEDDKADSIVRSQLEIQIRERFPFTPGPDDIMAELMIDLGDCYAMTFSYELAKAFYTIAEKYYGASSSLTQPRINEMLALRSAHEDVQVPEESKTAEGMNIIIKGVRYNSIIDNNDNPPYTIDWSQHLIDTDSLLGLVNLEAPIIHPDEASATAPNTTEDVEMATALPSEEETVTVEKNRNWALVLVASLTGMCTLIFIYFINQRRARK